MIIEGIIEGILLLTLLNSKRFDIKYNMTTDDFRRECVRMKETFAVERIDYNIITRCSQRHLQTISDLEEKIMKLEVKVATLNMTTNEKIGDDI